MASSRIPSAANPPLASPPPGVVPDYQNPISIQYQMFITGGVCLALIVMFAAVRFGAICSGIVKARGRWIEATSAWTILLALLYIIACVVLSSYDGVYGVHEWDILLLNLRNKAPLVITVVLEVTFPIVLFFVKFCLLMFYIDIFGQLRWLRYSCYVLMVIVGSLHLSIAISYLALCAPLHGSTWIDYLVALNRPTCVRASKKLLLVQGCFNLASDTALLLLPLPAVWSLKLPTRQKLGISIMFLTGVCAVVASALGVYYRVLTVREWGDLTWWTIANQATSTGEVTAGTIVFCMPAVAAVLRRIMGHTSTKSTWSLSRVLRLNLSQNSWFHRLHSSGTEDSTEMQSPEKGVIVTQVYDESLDGKSPPIHRLAPTARGTGGVGPEAVHTGPAGYV